MADAPLFFAGGECLQRLGVLVQRTATWEESGTLETFTRADTATCADINRTLKTAESGQPRVEWLDSSTPALLLEAASENLFTRSEDMTHAEWNATRVTRASNQASGPDGATTLDEIIETTATGQHYLSQTKTVTADAVVSISAWYNANTRPIAFMQVSEAADSTNRIQGFFDLSTGTVGTTAENGTGSVTSTTIEDFTDVESGLYRCTLTGTVGNSATSLLALVGMCVVDGTSSYTGDGSSSIYLGFAQFEEGVPSSYIATTTASVTRAADSFYADFPFPPQAMTVYMDVRNWVAGINGVTLWHIGSATTGTDPRLELNAAATTGVLGAVYDDGSTLAVTGTASAPSAGERVESLVTLTAAGVVDFAVSIDAGTQVDVASAAGGALPTAWADTRMYINSSGTSSAANTATYALKVARGVQTLAHMRAL